MCSSYRRTWWTKKKTFQHRLWMEAIERAHGTTALTVVMYAMFIKVCCSVLHASSTHHTRPFPAVFFCCCCSVFLSFFFHFSFVSRMFTPLICRPCLPRAPVLDNMTLERRTTAAATQPTTAGSNINKKRRTRTMQAKILTITIIIIIT